MLNKSSLNVAPLNKGAYVKAQQSQIYISKDAYEYWINELSNKNPTTIYQYKHYFNQFLEFLNTTPNKLIEQRK
ncbi:hypothetical protein E2P30_01175 [Candidatus Bathyarchaeota archaeon]|nr:hypothetical protein E2P30_01175 [Candidatus Bathyarchaeota archaeon]